MELAVLEVVGLIAWGVMSTIGGTVVGYCRGSSRASERALGDICMPLNELVEHEKLLAEIGRHTVEAAAEELAAGEPCLTCGRQSRNFVGTPCPECNPLPSDL